MFSNINISSDFFLAAFALIFPIFFVIAMSQNGSRLSLPKKRDFAQVLADWASQRGLPYAPQRVQVISGVYNNRWFAMGTTNEENTLRIRMRVKNPRRTSLQIFGDWLEDSGMIAFINRFRVYSTPAGLSETLFAKNTTLRESLLDFPELRARFDLFSDPRDPHHLHYSLLTDLPGAETLEKIMASLARFCDAFEQQLAQQATVDK